MKFLQAFLLVTFATLLIGQAGARSGRKCTDCRKREKGRRRERAESRKSRRKTDLAEPVNILPVPTGLQLSEAQQTKYLEELAKSHPFLFSNGKRSRQTAANKTPTDHYTQAIVNAVEARDAEYTLPVLRVIGKFGYHSLHQHVFGRMIHITDRGLNGSHFGCSGDISNKCKRAIKAANGPWVALISRGRCMFLVKIKLAEKYNASAVVVYDTDANGEVEVMRTIGTRAPSLMIDSTGGNRLAALAAYNTPIYLNISVGAINIQTTEKPHSPTTKSKTKALVDIHSNEENIGRVSLHKTTGKFGNHSPLTQASGRVIHIQDFESEDSHYGCSGRILNEDEVATAEGKWIALVARGKCNQLVKVKLAERYSASAVVIYDTAEFDGNQEAVNAIGANITTLTIGMIDGRKTLQLLKDGHAVYIDIGIDTSRRESSGVPGNADCARYSHVTVVLTLLFSLNTVLG